MHEFDDLSEHMVCVENTKINILFQNIREISLIPDILFTYTLSPIIGIDAGHCTFSKNFNIIDIPSSVAAPYHPLYLGPYPLNYR